MHIKFSHYIIVRLCFVRCLASLYDRLTRRMISAACILGVTLRAMERKDVRQRFAGSQHQKYLHETDEGSDGEKCRSPHSQSR